MSKKRKTHHTIHPQANVAPIAASVVSMPMPAHLQDRAPDDGSRLGDILRTTREKRGDDLYQIAEYLCIRPDFLKALEENQYDKLPADAYVIGFLRSYALHLGLDGKDAIDRYRHEMAGRRRKPNLNMPIPAAESRAPSMIIMAGAVLGALLIYAVWYGISSTNRTSVSRAPTLPTTVTTEAVIPTTNIPITTTIAPQNSAASSDASTAPELVTPPAAIVLPAPAPAATSGPIPSPASGKDNNAPKTPPVKPANLPTPLIGPAGAAALPPVEAVPAPQSPSSISIYAIQPSWVMVTDSNGKTVFDRVLKAGETYKVPNGKGYNLTTGNIAGIALSLDGISLPRLVAPKDSSRVVRGIALDPARLRAGTSDFGE